MKTGQVQIKWKLLSTFLIVIAVCIVVATVITRQLTINAFNDHVANMDASGMGGMNGMMNGMAADLQSSLSGTLNVSLLWGGIVAAATALFLSLFIARRITRPIKNMAAVTSHIAEGDYSQRVDVSSHDELGSLAHSFNSMAASLEEMQRMRRELMANIAHELRTPLTSISGYMEGIADGVIKPTPEVYDLVRHEASRLGRLVDDLSRLSRAESGQEVFTSMHVPSSPFLEGLGRKLEPQYLQKGVSLNVEVDPATPALLADEDKMNQVLVNLLDNALRYTEPGGRVDVRAAGRNGHVDISVADTGMGISAEDADHIFERFYRADKSRSRAKGGSGIGLTIAKRYVEAMGGSIGVESTEGKGTKFSLNMPSARG